MIAIGVLLVVEGFVGLVILAAISKHLLDLAAATKQAVMVAMDNAATSRRMADVIARPSSAPTVIAVPPSPVTRVVTLPDAPGEH